MLSKTLVAGLRRFRSEHNLSIRGYAGLAKISEKAVRGIDSPDWNPTLRTVEALETPIPKELMSKYMAEANDNDTSSEPQAAPDDRGEDHTEAA